jgi:hypothetical protein
LSRLIDETGTVLGLREPLPLRTLADLADTAVGAATRETRLDARLGTFLRLWRRGYPETRSVVVKATSSSGRLAQRLLAIDTTARAVYLNLKAEPHLATLLAGANAMTDLRGFEAVLENLGDRVLALDFDQVLGDLAPSVQRVVDHLGIVAPRGFSAAIAQSPSLTRYS